LQNFCSRNFAPFSDRKISAAEILHHFLIAKFLQQKFCIIFRSQNFCCRNFAKLSDREISAAESCDYDKFCGKNVFSVSENVIFIFLGVFEA